MTKAEKRVAVAKDVLAQIKAKTIRAKRGYYLKAKLLLAPKEGDDVQALLKAGNVRSCSACALGSAFLSYARLYDNVKVEVYGDFHVDRDWNAYANGDSSPSLSCDVNGQRPNQTLGQVFSDEQMEMIEHAFEGPSLGPNSMTSIPDDHLTKAVQARAINYGRRYPKNEDRLIAIMRNIVRNKGTFKPSAR